MRIEGEAMWALLRQLDDPDHLEWPAGFDYEATLAAFDRLTARFESAFGCRCLVHRDIQDASLHGSIEIPADATACGGPLAIYVSNFGSLATLSVENPGVYDDEEFAELLDPADAQRAYDALEVGGYLVVPEAPLWQPYDGPSRYPLSNPVWPTTWWSRYFDFL